MRKFMFTGIMLLAGLNASASEWEMIEECRLRDGIFLLQESRNLEVRFVVQDTALSKEIHRDLQRSDFLSRPGKGLELSGNTLVISGLNQEEAFQGRDYFPVHLGEDILGQRGLRWDYKAQPDGRFRREFLKRCESL